jgi:hypothetical protein
MSHHISGRFQQASRLLVGQSTYLIRLGTKERYDLEVLPGRLCKTCVMDLGSIPHNASLK